MRAELDSNPQMTTREAELLSSESSHTGRSKKYNANSVWGRLLRNPISTSCPHFLAETETELMD